MRLNFLLVLSLALGCQSKKRDAVPTLDPVDVIIEKASLYLSLVPEVQDAFGFIHSDKCDSLLWSSLISVSGATVDIKAAQGGTPGQWFRTPYHDCYHNSREDIDSTRRSGSTISRDMLVGLMWALYYQSDLVALDDLRSFGKDNNWAMGEGSIDRTYFTPNFQDTLFRLLGRTYEGLPYLWVDPGSDHQRHVVALNIILRGEREGKIDDEMYQLLKDFRNDEPRNALFQYGAARFSDGDQSQTIEDLNDLEMFPDEGPTPRCQSWFWERSSNKWFGCDSMKVASGGDYMFIAKLLENSK